MKLQLADIISYVAYVALFVLAVVAGQHNTLAAVALGLSLVCAAFWVVARWQLGEAFSVTAQARHLVTSGLYSRIRHPIYVFGTLANLFAVLALLGIKGLSIWVIVLAVQVIRLTREERVLAQQFGDEYKAYRSKTWF